MLLGNFNKKGIVMKKLIFILLAIVLAIVLFLALRRVIKSVF